MFMSKFNVINVLFLIFVNSENHIQYFIYNMQIAQLLKHTK